MKIEFTYRFEAAHRFLQSSSIPCMTPHGHTWYASLVLNYIAPGLNASQMSVEFSVLKKHFKQLIQETFDHSYMHNRNDPVVEVLRREGHEPRLLPFPGDPTTELIALFLFHKMSVLLTSAQLQEQVEVDSVILQETPTNKIHMDKEFYQSEIKNQQQFEGWWTSADIRDRSLRGK